MKHGEFIGKGREHKVYEDPADPNYVVKTPRLQTLIILNIIHPRQRATVVADEVNVGTTLKTRTNDEVQIPQTHVLFRYHRSSYSMRQRRIIEDGSVPDIETVLANHGLDTLVWRYRTSSDNFMSQNGVVYNIDPTRNPLTRIVEKFNLLPEEKYRDLLIKRREFMQKIKHPKAK